MPFEPEDSKGRMLCAGPQKGPESVRYMLLRLWISAIFPSFMREMPLTLL